MLGRARSLSSLSKSSLFRQPSWSFFTFSSAVGAKLGSHRVVQRDEPQARNQIMQEKLCQGFLPPSLSMASQPSCRAHFSGLVERGTTQEDNNCKRSIPSHRIPARSFAWDAARRGWITPCCAGETIPSELCRRGGIGAWQSLFWG